MIKTVDISQEKELTKLHIECDIKQSGIKSIEIICEPEKLKEVQEFIFKTMQLLSLPEKVSKAAANIGVLFNKAKR